MKAKEVLNILNISRQTLSKYVNNGTIDAMVLKNGDYSYDQESVYEVLNAREHRLKNTSRVKRWVIVFPGKDRTEKRMKLVNDAVSVFMKDHLGDDIYVDETRKLDDVLDDIQRYRVKELVVMDDDYETMSALDRTGQRIFRNANCKVTVLRCSSDPEFFDDWNLPRFVDFVRRVLLNTKDDEFRRKLQVVENVLTI